jgi:DDE superfamily endonuclease
MRIEHEYKRLGSWAYLAALDVHRAKIFGRCETHSGIASFDRLVDQVMRRRPSREARRVFWIVDNGSAHRGPKAVQRLLKKCRNLALVHGPIHAGWLNRIEIYFSIIQRKVLAPNDFTSLIGLSQRLVAFECHYGKIARPFEWRFTRKELSALLSKLGRPLAQAA